MFLWCAAFIPTVLVSLYQNTALSSYERSLHCSLFVNGKWRVRQVACLLLENHQGAGIKYRNHFHAAVQPGDPLHFVYIVQGKLLPNFHLALTQL